MKITEQLDRLGAAIVGGAIVYYMGVALGAYMAGPVFL